MVGKVYIGGGSKYIMKVKELNKESIYQSNKINAMYQDYASFNGRERLIKLIKKTISENKNARIDNCFIDFKKDIKRYKVSKKTDIVTRGMIEDFKSNKNSLPIFTVDDDSEDYENSKSFIPFNNFFISSNLVIEYDLEIYSIGGMYLKKLDEDLYCVLFLISKSIDDYWIFGNISFHRNRLITEDSPGDYINSTEIPPKVLIQVNKKIIHLINKIIYKMTNKEYTNYQKYENGKINSKPVEFICKRKIHKRHFWKDSGRFNIPFYTREELIQKGYGIDELVVKNGELRKDVPFRFINDNSPLKKGNKIFELRKKKILRCEERIFKILRDLFPSEYIRRHDRRTLKGLELDFNLPNLRLAIEYDGEQHYDKNLCEKVFKSDFNELKKRDRKKDKLCLKKKITLIRIKYDEPLKKNHIKQRLKGIIK